MKSGQEEATKLTRKDFAAAKIRWCPGCGDYAVLNALQRAMASLGTPRNKFALISGIGCSSRLPYYNNTYGFHTLHGRPLPVALGVKTVNPSQSVWVITGDGDCLSIGGNHFIHTMRRNPDINIVLFNNQIYGLTKGQFSPTSPKGLRTKSSPTGSIESPLRALPLALTAGATFIARVPDTNIAMMQNVFVAAEQHRGTSLIEVLVNCPIFNDDCHSLTNNVKNRSKNTIKLQQGKPMVFGESLEQGLRLVGTQLEVVDSNNSDVLLHNSEDENPQMALMLAALDIPLPYGIFRQVRKQTYGEQVVSRSTSSEHSHSAFNLKRLLVGENNA